GAADTVADASRGCAAPMGGPPVPSLVTLHSVGARHGLPARRVAPPALGSSRPRARPALPTAARRARARHEARAPGEARQAHPRAPAPLAPARRSALPAGRSLQRPPDNAVAVDNFPGVCRARRARRRDAAYPAAYPGDLAHAGRRAHLGGGRLARHDAGDALVDLRPPSPPLPTPRPAGLAPTPLPLHCPPH